MIWKRLIEFDDACEVSDTGLIKVNGQIKKGTVDTKGYLQVWVDGKLRMAHRLIALILCTGLLIGWQACIVLLKGLT